ncbi:hypothetical protein JX266_003726 [Neoarthrinium moseri]|nr:hypothetical protein JX266_003726 [Neoarthrinium moseri]
MADPDPADRHSFPGPHGRQRHLIASHCPRPVPDIGRELRTETRSSCRLPIASPPPSTRIRPRRQLWLLRKLRSSGLARCIASANTSEQLAVPPFPPTQLRPRSVLPTSSPTAPRPWHTANMSLSDSFAMPDASVSDNDDIDSLPSSTTDSFSSEDEDYDAQREWERSLEQLQLLLTMILVPFAGKYFGRKFAYWSWARYMEWAHNVEIRWTNKKAFKAAGVAEAASSL